MTDVWLDGIYEEHDRLQKQAAKSSSKDEIIDWETEVDPPSSGKLRQPGLLKNKDEGGWTREYKTPFYGDRTDRGRRSRGDRFDESHQDYTYRKRQHQLDKSAQYDAGDKVFIKHDEEGKVRPATYDHKKKDILGEWHGVIPEDDPGKVWYYSDKSIHRAEAPPAASLTEDTPEQVDRMVRHAMPITQDLLQKHIDEHGPYAYHMTESGNVPGILEQGLIPHEGEREGKGRDDWTDPPSRPNHVYLSVGDTSREMLPGMQDPAFLKVDLRKLDPQNFNSDEDHFYDDDEFLEPRGLQSPGMYDENDELEYDTLERGQWANDYTEQLDAPDVVDKSMGQLSFAHKGHIPPEAIAGWAKGENTWDAEWKNLPKQAGVADHGDELGWANDTEVDWPKDRSRIPQKMRYEHRPHPDDERIQERDMHRNMRSELGGPPESSNEGRNVLGGLDDGNPLEWDDEDYIKLEPVKKESADDFDYEEAEGIGDPEMEQFTMPDKWTPEPKKGEPGTLIQGTNRIQDTLPAMLDAMEDLAPQEHEDMWDGYNDVLSAMHQNEHEGGPELSDEDWDVIGQAEETAREVLNDYAPDNHYFGAHPDDPTDIGFWDWREGY